MHPYLTERMLHQSEALAPLGRIAVQHRERLDGSGYPRGLAGHAISRPARIIAAADAYQAMREPRPYRPALTADEAATQLRIDVRAGRLDAEVSEAVLRRPAIAYGAAAEDQPVDQVGLLHRHGVRGTGHDRELGVGQRALHGGRVLDRQREVVVGREHERRRRDALELPLTS
jgi:hypothetical protein